MGKITHKAQRAIDAHTAYEHRCKDIDTAAWLERKRIARGLLGKRSLWCGDCGKAIVLPAEDFSALQAEYNENNETWITCPHCGRKLRLQDISTKHALEVYQELVTIGEYQCIRVWMIEQYYHKDQPARIGFFHVYDEMWSEKGDCFLFSRRLGWTGSWCVWNPFSKNDPSLQYRQHGGNQFTDGWHICATRVRSSHKWVKQRALTKHLCGETDYQRTFRALLLHDAFTETIWKANNADAFYNYTSRSTTRYMKAAMKVAWRHGWREFARDWFDYVDNLAELGLDTHNPAYICPQNFTQAHDWALDLVCKKREKEAAERRAAELARERKHVESYTHFIEQFADVCIVSGDIVIQPLPTVKSFYEEAQEMKHCVWTNKYYAKKNCLILSARVDGKRKETIEIDTKNWRALQIFGKCNGESDRHKEIVAAVNNWCEEQKRNNRRVHA